MVTIEQNLAKNLKMGGLLKIEGSQPSANYLGGL